MHHDGLFWTNLFKIESLNELSTLSKRADFMKSRMTLEGCILASTKKREIPGAQDKSWDDLRQDDCLLSEGSLDAETLFNPV